MKHFKLESEIKKHLSSALIAAFGLIAAIAWKDVLTEYLDTAVSLSPIKGKLVSALIISAISLIRLNEP